MSGLSRRAAVKLLACGVTGGLTAATATATAAATARASARASAGASAIANAQAPAPAEASRDLSQWLQPIPRSARFEDPGHFVWCGSAVRGRDGRYHLFYSRWPLAHGFEAWVTHSEIARAVADSPLGPFRPAGVVLPARGAEFWDGLCTHNPTVHQFGDRFYLHYMGNTGDGVLAKPLNWTHRNNQRIGVAVADSPEGPWRRRDTPLIAPTEGFHDALCCNNPTIARRAAGDYLLIYKAVGRARPLPFGGPVVHIAALGASPDGTFVKQPQPLFTSTGSDFPAEDPFIWTDGPRVRAIVKDMAGAFTHQGRSLALFESADEGLTWAPAKPALVSGLDLHWQDGPIERVEYLERPQLLIEDGQPRVLYAAVRPTDRSRPTFNVHIPLRPPRPA